MCGPVGDKALSSHEPVTGQPESQPFSQLSPRDKTEHEAKGWKLPVAKAVNRQCAVQSVKLLSQADRKSEIALDVRSFSQELNGMHGEELLDRRLFY